MLQLDRLTLVQGSFRLTADWVVPEGATVAIIGPSGAGKSSLLMAIAGFLAPQAGRVLWQGTDLGTVPPGLRPVSLLFQDQNLFPHLTIARNLGLGLNPRLRLTAAEWAQVDAVLDRVGLSGLGDRRPAELSGGQQSRAALARALLRARPLLLLDEPFAALGPALKANMLALVAEVVDETRATLLRARPLLLLDEPFAALGPALKADMLALVAEVVAETRATLLMVTHDPKDALGHTDMTVLIDAGMAHAPAPTADLFATPPAALRAYLGT